MAEAAGWFSFPFKMILKIIQTNINIETAAWGRRSRMRHVACKRHVEGSGVGEMR